MNMHYNGYISFYVKYEWRGRGRRGRGRSGVEKWYRFITHLVRSPETIKRIYTHATHAGEDEKKKFITVKHKTAQTINFLFGWWCLSDIRFSIHSFIGNGFNGNPHHWLSCVVNVMTPETWITGFYEREIERVSDGRYYLIFSRLLSFTKMENGKRAISFLNVCGVYDA